MIVNSRILPSTLIHKKCGKNSFISIYTYSPVITVGCHSCNYKENIFIPVADGKITEIDFSNSEFTPASEEQSTESL